MARVDVMMPAYNAAATLREAVASLRAQTMADLRIVIVNDGSTDETPAIAAALAAEDARVHVLTQQNRGIVEARNAALAACDAEYVAVLDSDDLSYPVRLERQLAYLAAHPACVAVGGEVDHMDETGAALGGLPQWGPPSGADPAKAPAMEPYIVHSTLLARRADVVAVGGYRHVPNSEDSDLFWRLQERGALHILPERVGKYRVHVASTSSEIVSGRVMAVGSQLGALSTLRRRAGRADMSFAFEMLAALKQAATLEAMCALASRGMSADEREHLRIAAGTKFMELARYRPYEPEASDCAFIRAALPLARRLSPQNQKEVRWYVTVTAARLVRKGKLREAMMLTPAKDIPIAAARVLMAR